MKIKSRTGVSEGVKVKPKMFHEKCDRCMFRDQCGKNEYLRLSTKGVLLPCMYRSDLHIPLNGNEDAEVMRDKVAIGFRRIRKDDI